MTLSAAWPRGHDGATAQTLLVVERARPSQILQFLVEAHGLTQREQEVVAHLARGAGTVELARALGISTHTAKDHVKAVLAKVDVRNRAELLAKLFHDDLQPGMVNH